VVVACVSDDGSGWLHDVLAHGRGSTGDGGSDLVDKSDYRAGHHRLGSSAECLSMPIPTTPTWTSPSACSISFGLRFLTDTLFGSPYGKEARLLPRYGFPSESWSKRSRSGVIHLDRFGWLHRSQRL